MNHVNRVQGEQGTEYHVIQWKNSEFHNHHFQKDNRLGAGPFSVAKVIGGGDSGQTSVEGQGSAVPGASAEMEMRVAHGGLQAGLASMGNDEVMITSKNNICYKTMKEEDSYVNLKSQTEIPEQTISMLGFVSVNTHRLKDAAKKMQKFFDKQKKKFLGAPTKKVIQKAEGKSQSGTRKADKEILLSMRADQHYLLDSYDRTGNYSELGKS